MVCACHRPASGTTGRVVIRDGAHTVRVNALLAVVGILGVSASGPLMAGTSAPALAIGFWRNALGTLAIAPFA